MIGKNQNSLTEVLMYRRLFFVTLLVLCTTPTLLGQAPVSEERPPIIDMHMHAYPADGLISGPSPITGEPSAQTDEAIMQASLAARGRSTFSELRWYPPMEAAKGSLSWVFRAKQPESVRTGP